MMIIMMHFVALLYECTLIPWSTRSINKQTTWTFCFNIDMSKQLAHFRKVFL